MSLDVLIRQLQGAVQGQLGGLSIGVGADSLTGTGATTATKTITHGLDFTPQIVVVIPDTSASDMNPSTGSYTSTQFTVLLRSIDGAAFAGAKSFTWVAVG